MDAGAADPHEQGPEAEEAQRPRRHEGPGDGDRSAGRQVRAEGVERSRQRHERTGAGEGSERRRLEHREATSKLNAAGFNRQPEDRRQHAPQGQVISQNPAPGSSAPRARASPSRSRTARRRSACRRSWARRPSRRSPTLEAAGFQVSQQSQSVNDPSQDGHRPVAESGRRHAGSQGLDGDDRGRPVLAHRRDTTTTTTRVSRPAVSAWPSSRAAGRASTRSPWPRRGRSSRASIPSGTRSPRSRSAATARWALESGDPTKRTLEAKTRRGRAETLPVPAESRDARGARRRGRRPADPPRPVRRGRHRAGAARARRRPLRGRRRGGVRARHGQGPVQEGDARQRHPGRGAPRDPTRRHGRESVRLSRVRQAGAARLVGRHHEGAHGGRARSPPSSSPSGTTRRCSSRSSWRGRRSRSACSAIACRLRSPRCPARSTRSSTSGTTSRRSTTRAGWSSSSRRPTCRRRRSSCSSDARSSRSSRASARVSRGSTSSYASPTARSSSTSSTRCPASPRRACGRRLFEASGLGYADALDRLIELALERHERRSKLVY